MSEGPQKRIVLFGLSANPPTGLGGHMGIVRYFSCIELTPIPHFSII